MPWDKSVHTTRENTLILYERTRAFGFNPKLIKIEILENANGQYISAYFRFNLDAMRFKRNIETRLKDQDVLNKADDIVCFKSEHGNVTEVRLKMHSAYHFHIYTYNTELSNIDDEAQTLFYTCGYDLELMGLKTMPVDKAIHKVLEKQAEGHLGNANQLLIYYWENRYKKEENKHPLATLEQIYTLANAIRPDNGEYFIQAQDICVQVLKLQLHSAALINNKQNDNLIYFQKLKQIFRHAIKGSVQAETDYIFALLCGNLGVPKIFNIKYNNESLIHLVRQIVGLKAAQSVPPMPEQKAIVPSEDFDIEQCTQILIRAIESGDQKEINHLFSLLCGFWIHNAIDLDIRTDETTFFVLAEVINQSNKQQFAKKIQYKVTLSGKMAFFSSNESSTVPEIKASQIIGTFTH